MKLIIAGSRSITDYEILRHALKDSGLWKKYKKKIEVVSGMAPGVDTLALEFASRNGLKVHKFPADWDNLEAPGAKIKTRLNGTKYNSRAGAYRNIQMGQFAEGLLAVWDGKSRGTKHMIEFARAVGLEVFVKVVE